VRWVDEMERVRVRWVDEMERVRVRWVDEMEKVRVRWVSELFVFLFHGFYSKDTGLFASS